MEDEKLIELFFERDESAIRETEQKYGPYCKAIAGNIVGSPEDVQECVNDTYMRLWSLIPPERPRKLGVFIGRIARSIAIDRFRRDRAKKNGGGQAGICLEELSECIGEESPIEDRLILKELLDSFLRELSDRDRDIFLLRYWYMMPLKDIAKRFGLSEGAVKMVLHRLREKLRARLDKEGVGL